MSEVAIKVAVRVRPFNRRELEQNQRNIIRVLDESALMFDPDDDEDEFFYQGTKQNYRDITKRVKKKLTMEFDSVFNEDSVNADIFEKCMKPLVNSVMEGFNCSVFVYGATGAGKTFTMLGSDDFPGITFLTMQELFRQMEEHESERRFDIGISYLEVYNEQVMNLLTKTGPLKLREDSNGVVVGGLVLKQIKNADELIELLHLGNKNRTQHPTDANAESSRSHAIFQVHIRMIEKKTTMKRTVKLSMIDLAGSERAQSTKCKGLRFKEGANINKSLLALGNCINKLADGSKHVPYRDSNLTRILKDSLGGNCQTLMIANISPSSITYEDTYNTLKYASRAKKIRTTCRQNVVTTNMPKEFLLRKCNDQTSEIERLKADLERHRERSKILESQVMDQKSLIAQKAVTDAGGGGDFSQSVDLSEWHHKIDDIYGDLRKIREHCYRLQSGEKFLKLRIKFKEQCEHVKKILVLDSSQLNLDLSKLEGTIIKYNKEASRKVEDQTRWVKRFNESKRLLDDLKRQIREAKLDDALKLYIDNKEAELENAKLLLKIEHMTRITNEYKIESAMFDSIIVSACEIIQDSYLLLRSLNELDTETLDKYQKLVKMLQGQRSVKFADSEDSTMEHLATANDEESAHFQHLEMSLNNIGSHEEIHLQSPSTSSSSSINVAKKRACDLGDELDAKKIRNDDDNFARPKSMKTINFDAPQSAPSSSHDMNSTFSMDMPPPKIFKERTNQAPSAITKALKQSKSTASSKFVLNVNKENKKFSPSNRIKKLPRTPNRIVGSKAPASLARQPKLVKSAVSSSLTTSSDRFRAPQKK